MLWIGGTSALARTFFEELYDIRADLQNRNDSINEPQAKDSFIATGIESSRPTEKSDGWDLPPEVPYVPLDLTEKSSVASFWERMRESAGVSQIDSVVLSVRLSLVFSGNRHLRLATYLGDILRSAINMGCRAVVHVSSIAVADHTKSQVMWSEDDPLPPDFDGYAGQYDAFKRSSEEIVAEVCTDARDLDGNRRATFVNLRVGGLFSHGMGCIQCNSLALQKYVSVYSCECIDFNSSRNAGVAIYLLIHRMRQAGAVSPVYYYTRPTTSRPVRYGEHLSDIRRACQVPLGGLWIPPFIGLAFIKAFRSLVAIVSFLVGDEKRSQMGPLVGLLRSLDYLLQVGLTTHTFDNGRFICDFGSDIARWEEGIPAAFRRIVHTRTS